MDMQQLGPIADEKALVFDRELRLPSVMLLYAQDEQQLQLQQQQSGGISPLSPSSLNSPVSPSTARSNASYNQQNVSVMSGSNSYSNSAGSGAGAGNGAGNGNGSTSDRSPIARAVASATERINAWKRTAGRATPTRRAIVDHKNFEQWHSIVEKFTPKVLSISLRTSDIHADLLAASTIHDLIVNKVQKTSDK
jgi:hypothetical protein